MFQPTIVKYELFSSACGICKDIPYAGPQISIHLKGLKSFRLSFNLWIIKKFKARLDYPKRVSKSPKL